jgi:hypothetical protein
VFTSRSQQCATRCPSAQVCHSTFLRSFFTACRVVISAVLSGRKHAGKRDKKKPLQHRFKGENAAKYYAHVRCIHMLVQCMVNGGLTEENACERLRIDAGVTQKFNLKKVSLYARRQYRTLLIHALHAEKNAGRPHSNFDYQNAPDAPEYGNRDECRSEQLASQHSAGGNRRRWCGQFPEKYTVQKLELALLNKKLGDDLFAAKDTDKNGMAALKTACLEQFSTRTT